uniref:Uncharacterized protein n=1 Tax=Pseudo-nitzschia australis TaxID=44445 RepID=A0A7S4AUE3_9STRA
MSMPSVPLNPWKRCLNSFSLDVVHLCLILAFGCLLSSLYAANFFNSSSQMDLPAIVKCCNMRACVACLYPFVNGDVFVVCCVYVLGVGVWALGSCRVAPLGVGMYKL